MKETRNTKTKKLDQTERVVKFVQKSVGTDKPVQALKQIKDAILKNIGFTISPEDKDKNFDVIYEPVKIEANGGKGTSNEHYQPATIYDILRSYRASIRALDVKHNTLGGRNCPIKTFKKEYGSKIEEMGLSELLNELNPKADLSTLRLVKKKLGYALRNRPAIKDQLKKVKIENQAYYWVEACIRVVSNLVNEQQVTSKDEKQTNRILINPEYILAWALDILNNEKDDYQKICLALMAVTGRRTTEIIKTATFTKSKSDSEVMFEGQLKQKDREELGRGAGIYAIPVLVEPELVIKALKRLRKLTKDHTVKFMKDDGSFDNVELLEPAYRLDVRHSEGVNDAYSSLLSGRIKRLFNTELMRPYLFRSAYTEIAFDKGLRNKGESRQAFRKRVLGHADYNSQGNYERFGLSNEVSIIGLERDGENTGDVNSKPLLELLAKTHDEVFENTRAKAMHKLHEHAEKLAKKGELQLSDITATWVRAQIIEGKKIGASTVKQWLGILGL